MEYINLEGRSFANKVVDYIAGEVNSRTKNQQNLDEITESIQQKVEDYRRESIEDKSALGEKLSDEQQNAKEIGQFLKQQELIIKNIELDFTFQLTGVLSNLATKQIKIDPRLTFSQIIQKIRSEYNLNPILKIQLISNGKIINNIRSINPKTDTIKVLATQSGGGFSINPTDLEIAVIDGLLVQKMDSKKLELQICNDLGISLKELKNYLQQSYDSKKLESVLIDVFSNEFNKYKEKVINQREALLRLKDYLNNRLGYNLDVDRMSDYQKKYVLDTLSKEILGDSYNKIMLKEYRDKSVKGFVRQYLAYQKLKNINDFNGNPLLGGDLTKIKRLVKEAIVAIGDFYKVVDESKGIGLEKYITTYLTLGQQYYENLMDPIYTSHLLSSGGMKNFDLEHIAYRHMRHNSNSFQKIGINHNKEITSFIFETLTTKKGVAIPSPRFNNRVAYRIHYGGNYYYLILGYNTQGDIDISTSFIADDPDLLNRLNGISPSYFDTVWKF